MSGIDGRAYGMTYPRRLTCERREGEPVARNTFRRQHVPHSFDKDVKVLRRVVFHLQQRADLALRFEIVQKPECEQGGDALSIGRALWA